MTQTVTIVEAPEALRGLPAWVRWEFEYHDDLPKPLKMPYYAKSGRVRRKHGTPRDREQLVNFHEAMNACEGHPFKGVGFAPMLEWGIVPLDFDACIDEEGNIDPLVLKLVSGTYAEYSPSGKGIRAFVTGYVPRIKDVASQDKFGIETFHDSGYVTFTGRVIQEWWAMGWENTVAGASQALVDFIHGRLQKRGNQGQDGEGVAGESDFTRELAIRRVTQETIEDLRDALMNGFTQEQVDNYNTWAPKIGQGLASLKGTEWEGDGLELWHEVSARSEKYQEAQAEEKWASFSPRKITFRTIFHMAHQNGWVNPRSAQALKAGGAEDYAKLEDRSDIGNANLLVNLTDGNLRYVWEWKRWLWWEVSRWIDDKSGAYATAGAKLVAQHYHRKAEELKRQAADDSLATGERNRIRAASESVEKWALHCRNKKAIDSMMAMAARDARVVVSAADLDRDPWLFGVANGTIDLRTGQLREASRDEFVTLRSPTTFDPTAKAPRWVQFINEITGKPAQANPTPRPALAHYLQKMLGYCLTGSVQEQKVFIAWGEGSNGKSVAFDIVQKIAGNYARTLEPKFLMAGEYLTNPESPSPVAATLAGARLALSCESKERQKLDVALIKRHSGGGRLTARACSQNTFEFEISHKLILQTNYKPALDHTDFALRGRLHMIPFNMKWNRPGHPKPDPTLPDGDKDLKDKLWAEAPGILAWLVEGAVLYGTDELKPPREVEDATQEYYAEQDPIGRWLLGYDQCDAKHGGTMAAELIQQFQEWQRMDDDWTGGGSMGSKSFGPALAERGISKHDTKKGARYGVTRKPEAA